MKEFKTPEEMQQALAELEPNYWNAYKRGWWNGWLTFLLLDLVGAVIIGVVRGVLEAIYK